MKVRDIMTTDVVSAKRGTSVNELAKLMGARDISGVPVLDDDGAVVGIVTELDMIARNTRLDMPRFIQILDLGRIPLERRSDYEHRMRHMLGTRAEDLMSEEVVTVGPDDSVEDLAELMVKRRVNPVPVVENGKLVGIVSRADIIDMMAAEVGEPPGEQ
ncbi:MAG TPA: CBS domain-containing protein [Anaerolineae bacterium]|nr:CBS domain-containing protein [Anaerolineae bacterium]